MSQLCIDIIWATIFFGEAVLFFIAGFAWGRLSARNTLDPNI